MEGGLLLGIVVQKGTTVLERHVSESGIVQWLNIRTKGSGRLEKRATSCSCNVALKVMDHISNSRRIKKENLTHLEEARSCGGHGPWTATTLRVVHIQESL
jgi:hypothetical protein